MIRNLSMACLAVTGLSFMMLACDGDTGSNLDSQVEPPYSSQSTFFSSSESEKVLLSSSSGTNLLQSSSSVAVSTVKYGTMQDSRDGKQYKTVVIGNKTWMAENLNFSQSADGSIVLDSTFCYDDIPANCEKYGRLYQEDDASKACPEGWRVPTEDDWIELSNTVKAEYVVDNLNSPLRAVGAWEDNLAATNASGFSALPAGFRNKSGQFDGEGKKTCFWGEIDKLYYAWMLSKQYDLDKESLIRGYYAYSIRCVSTQP